MAQNPSNPNEDGFTFGEWKFEVTLHRIHKDRQPAGPRACEHHTQVATPDRRWNLCLDCRCMVVASFPLHARRNEES